jgi:hypothetical protein
MPTLHLVERRSWATSLYDGPDAQNSDDERHGIPVAALTTRAAAQRRAEELTRAARLETNPFLLEGGELEFLSSLEEETILDRLTGLGLPPPGVISGHEYSWRNGLRDWAAWYDDLASQLTDAQRDGVWDLLDLLVLYAVVPVKLEE